MIPIFVVVLGLGCLCGTSSGFRFNTSTPTQCGPFTIQWDGGQEPFQFLLVPTVEVASGRILNITLPTGLTPPFSHTFDLSAPAGLEFLATMYDSTGFGTGGTTPVLTVGSSDDTSCLESNLLYDFTFQLSPASSPPQCSSQTITWPNNVSRPVNLFGLIPGGTAWQIPIPQQGTTYDWQVDIDDGTEYLLAMSDSGPYITGGSSPLIRVSSGSRECMNSTSPRSGGAGSGGTTTSGTSDPSASAPSASVSGVGGSSNGGQANGDQANNAEGSKSSTNIGAIVGGTMGGVAFIALLLLLLFCFCRKRSRPRRESADPMIRSYEVGGESTVEKRRSGAMDLLTGGRPRRQFSDDSTTEAREGGQEYQPSPFTCPDPNRDGVSGKAPVIPLGGENRQSVDSRTSRTESRSMEAGAPLTSEMGGTDASTQSNLGRQSSIMKPHTTDNRPLPQPVSGQRFVQHEDSGQVVDLPPRYDQLRTRNPDPE